ncbi:MAG: leucyl aminopeptidase [Alcanivorax sp.]|jgi:leucyl aminopeptidase
MEFQIFSGNVSELNTDCLVVTLDQSNTLSTSAKAVDEASNGFLSARVTDGDISGSAGKTLLLPGVSGVAARRVLLAGGSSTLSVFEAGKIASSVGSTVAKIEGSVAVDFSALFSESLPQEWWAEQLVLAIHAAQYRFTATKPAKEESKQASTLIWIGDDITNALNVADAKGLGTSYCKDLGNMPPNICTPAYLAAEAEALSKEAGFTCKVYDEADMEAMGAGAFYSVSKGSTEPGKVIIMEYKGAGDAQPHMIVGKGITFDTGGISLKPGAKMDEMKYDMCGAASVLGTMKTIAAIKPAVNIVAIITSAENMPAGNASKPGDVVTSLAGLTIEILNTDAEGRLVLCDALTLGIRDYKPATCVDVATLTGACMAALGKVNSGLFTTDEDLAGELLAAGQTSGDRVWRLPLEEDYKSGLDSNFADMANIGGPLAGATTAACFLSRFTEDTRWAHVDIAGPAWDGAGMTKGSTGRPVPLLTTYLLNKAV